MLAFHSMCDYSEDSSPDFLNVAYMILYVKKKNHRTHIGIEELHVLYVYVSLNHNSVRKMKHKIHIGVENQHVLYVHVSLNCHSVWR